VSESLGKNKGEKMTVREHITNKLNGLLKYGITTFKTSDIQELAYIGKHDYGKFLGSSETYTREFRRMRTDGILKVRKLDRKNRQQIWVVESIEY
tara:strand:+ start:118 stop:402 length:285 start_codon:yes stop_codon:yes gene_type:complete